MTDAMGNRLQSKDPVVTWNLRSRVLEFGFYMGKDHMNTHWALIRFEIKPNIYLHSASIIKPREVIKVAGANVQERLETLPDAEEWRKFMRSYICLKR